MRILSWENRFAWKRRICLKIVFYWEIRNPDFKMQILIFQSKTPLNVFKKRLSDKNLSTSLITNVSTDWNLQILRFPDPVNDWRDKENFQEKS